MRFQLANDSHWLAHWALSLSLSVCLISNQIPPSHTKSVYYSGLPNSNGAILSLWILLD